MKSCESTPGVVFREYRNGWKLRKVAPADWETKMRVGQACLNFLFRDIRPIKVEPATATEEDLFHILGKVTSGEIQLENDFSPQELARALNLLHSVFLPDRLLSNAEGAAKCLFKELLVTLEDFAEPDFIKEVQEALLEKGSL